MNRFAKTTLTAALLTTGAATLAGFGLSVNAGEETAAVTTLDTSNMAAATYKVDPVHSNILFKIRHAGLAYFYGHFDTFDGTVEIDPNNIENAKFNFTVEVGSVDTNNRSRDNHVRDADFFNARQYPKATFKSTSVKELSDGVYELNGTFDFHGVTNPVTARLTEVTMGQQQGKDAMGFHAVFTINRSEFGINKYVNPEAPESGPLGDKVEITVSIEAVNG